MIKDFLLKYWYFVFSSKDRFGKFTERGVLIADWNAKKAFQQAVKYQKKHDLVIKSMKRV